MITCSFQLQPELAVQAFALELAAARAASGAAAAETSWTTAQTSGLRKAGTGARRSGRSSPESWHPLKETTQRLVRLQKKIISEDLE